MCISFPYSDNPRLPVDIDDEVLVTHWHKRWLYGQKLCKNSKIPLKGWFPERCTALLIKPVIALNEESDNETSDDNKFDYNNKKVK